MAQTSLSCPLCSNETAFSTLECFQVSLLLVTTKRLSCPVCADVVFGLDKLTIHLFQHQAFGKVLPHHFVFNNEIVGLQQGDPRCSLLPVAEEISTQQCEAPTPVSPVDNAPVENPFAPAISNNNDFLQQPLTVEYQGKPSLPSEETEIQNTGNVCNTYNNEDMELQVQGAKEEMEKEETDPEITPITPDRTWHCPCCQTESPPLKTDYRQPTCEICLVSFSCIQFWNQHLLAVHKKNGKYVTEDEENDVECFTCKMCQAPCVDLPSLHVHMRSDHDDRPFLCHICYKSFKVKGSLRVHVRVVHGVVKKKKNKDKQGTNPLSPQSKVDDGASSSSRSPTKQWECDLCKKLFTTKYFLKKHKRLHTGETPYCCELCGRTFTFQQSYHKHMLYHSDERPHSCSECGKSFKELSTLNNHQRIHTGERPYVCENCGKSFRQRVSYLVHRRIHTGVMPYECKECRKTFRYKVSLRSHKCAQNTFNLQDSPAVSPRERIISENNFSSPIIQPPQWISSNNSPTSDLTTALVTSELEELITGYTSLSNSLISQQQCDLVTGLETINRDSVKDLLFPNM